MTRFIFAQISQRKHIPFDDSRTEMLWRFWSLFSQTIWDFNLNFSAARITKIVYFHYYPDCLFCYHDRFSNKSWNDDRPVLITEKFVLKLERWPPQFATKTDNNVICFINTTNYCKYEITWACPLHYMLTLHDLADLRNPFWSTKYVAEASQAAERQRKAWHH